MGKALTFLALFLLSFTLVGCPEKGALEHLPAALMTAPDGSELKVLIAVSEADQQNGLSGVQAADWPDSQGLLFAYPSIGKRRFWMPDTYFNLDIIFLDPDFSIVHIERDVPAHPGRDEFLAPIARTPDIYAQHVLELKTSSGMAKDWQIGQRLHWKGPQSLSSYLSEK